MKHNGQEIARSLPLRSRTRASAGRQVIAAVSGAMSRVFHTTRRRTLIVGVNPCTRVLAEELASANMPVALVGSGAERQSQLFVSAMNLTTSDELLLGSAGAETARCLVAATPDAGRNLSLCRTALDTFRIPIIIPRVLLPEGNSGWARAADSGMARVSWANLIQAIFPDGTLTPALSRLARAKETEQVADVTVQVPASIGRSIEQILPADCDIVMLRRRGLPMVVSHTSLELGDVLTVIGERDAVSKLRESQAFL